MLIRLGGLAVTRVARSSGMIGRAMQEGYGDQTRARRRRGVGVMCHARRIEQQPLDLVEKDPREGRDGLRPVGKVSH